MPNSHTELYIHYVWATWDSLPILTPDVEDAIYDCIHAGCREWQTHLLAVGGIADHIHVLVRLPATRNVAEVASYLKGASSHLATHRLSLPDFKWQGAYSARSVSPNGVPAVISYIENQKQHHALETVHHEWERIHDTE